MKKNLIQNITFIFILSVFFLSCEQKEVNTSNTKQLNSINQDTIGTQIWETKNLDVLTFQNGDTIPEAKSDEEWEKAADNSQPAWCYYENDKTKGEKYGKLYNWYAVNDKRGLVPSGYHVPSFEEWSKCIEYLGGQNFAAKKMKTKFGWDNEGNGDNSSNFSALPAGSRFKTGGFHNFATSGYWWTSTVDKEYDFLVYHIFIDSYDNYVTISSSQKGEGHSVRIMKNK